MALSSHLLSRDPQLVDVERGRQLLRLNSRGEGVVRLQLGLLSMGLQMPRSTVEMSRKPDGVFGPETEAVTRKFQASRGLTVDGVAGRLTIAKLDSLLPRNAATRPGDGCGVPATPIVAAARASETYSDDTSTSLSGLSERHRAIARPYYGSSLDFSRVHVTTMLGAGGRPFTLAIRAAPFPVECYLNVGTTDPDADLLIHELAHAWQAQHGFSGLEFMMNSAESQALASLIHGTYGVDASAYYYRPGKLFSLYGAEQIAVQVEAGVPSIMNVIRGIPQGLTSPANLASWSLPRYEVAGPGIVT